VVPALRGERRVRLIERSWGREETVHLLGRWAGCLPWARSKGRPQSRNAPSVG